MKKLEELLRRAEGDIDIEEKKFDFDEVEDLSEEERWKEEEIWETLSVAENREELKKEIEVIRRLIDKTSKIINKGTELKLTHLKRTLLNSNPEEKILIFTES